MVVKAVLEGHASKFEAAKNQYFLGKQRSIESKMFQSVMYFYYTYEDFLLNYGSDI